MNPPAKPRPAQDSYEASYMKEAGALLRREKTVWRYHWLLLLPLPITMAVIAMILAGVGSKPAPAAMALVPLLSSVLLLLSWITFRTLRVHVTEREVHIQYGIFGPRIPVASILSCRTLPYDMTRYGGWGVRRSLDGSWAYTLAGDSARVVEIMWRDGNEQRKVVVSSLDPDALVASIEQARATATPRLRAPADSIAATTADDALDAAAAEEALAARPDARRESRRS